YATQGSPKFLAVADLNDDGNLDIVASNGTIPPYNTNSLSVLLGNADGTFQSPVSYSVADTPQHVEVADINGDGIPDLVVASWGSSANNVGVLLGNGDGTFQNQITFPTGSQPHSVSITDLNGDDRPDLVVSDQHSDELRVLLSSTN